MRVSQFGPALVWAFGYSGGIETVPNYEITLISAVSVFSLTMAPIISVMRC